MSLDRVKTIPQYLLPKRYMTVLAGLLANVTQPQVKNYIIQRFIAKYQVNMAEALVEDPTAYPTFNDFFIRHLKPECRPLADADIIVPVDGAISEIGAIHEGQLIQAKGRSYSVQELLACDEAYAQHFLHGQFATLYLSPKDYHRVHMPINARLDSMTYIPGALFSVQPTTARVVPKLFARNERLAVSFTTAAGPMVMVLVGATIVGAIGTRWQGEIPRLSMQKTFDYSKEDQSLMQGDEMGYFKLGSTVIMLFSNETKVQWNPQLTAGSPIRFGEAMGHIGNTKAKE